jgi:hypothetical protein
MPTISATADQRDRVEPGPPARVGEDLLLGAQPGDAVLVDG